MNVILLKQLTKQIDLNKQNFDYVKYLELKIIFTKRLIKENNAVEN